MGDDRPIASVRVTADSLVARGPALYWGCILRAGGAASTLTLRNGDSANAPVRSDPSAATGETTVITLPRPVLFEFGIFADVDANIGSAEVLFSYPDELYPSPGVEAGTTIDEY